MTPAGGLILATLLGGMWATGVVAVWLGRRDMRKNVQALEKNPKQVVRSGFRSRTGRRVYDSADRMDVAIDRAIAPVDEFVAMTYCPNCNALGLHHITKFNKSASGVSASMNGATRNGSRQDDGRGEGGQDYGESNLRLQAVHTRH